MRVALLKVTVQPVFVAIDDDGEVSELVGQPIEVPGREWPTFATQAFGPSDLAGIASARLAALEAASPDSEHHASEPESGDLP